MDCADGSVRQRCWPTEGNGELAVEDTESISANASVSGAGISLPGEFGRRHGRKVAESG